MRSWIAIFTLMGGVLGGCTEWVPNGYDQISAASPTPRPDSDPNAGDLRAEEPYNSPAFHPTAAQ